MPSAMIVDLRSLADSELATHLVVNVGGVKELHEFKTEVVNVAKARTAAAGAYTLTQWKTGQHKALQPMHAVAVTQGNSCNTTKTSTCQGNRDGCDCWAKARKGNNTISSKNSKQKKRLRRERQRQRQRQSLRAMMIGGRTPCTQQTVCSVDWGLRDNPQETDLRRRILERKSQ